MLIISLKGFLCFCSVYRHFYNLSAFELQYVFIAWNLDPDSEKRMLPWFPGLPILRTGTSLAHEQAEISPSHLILPRFI